MNAFRRLPTALIAAVTLIAGFAVADATGVRALGGVVLVFGCGWCAIQWLRTRGWPIALTLTLVFLAAFTLSHPLAKSIGAWPSVVIVSAIVALVTYVVADRRRQFAKA